MKNFLALLFLCTSLILSGQSQDIKKDNRQMADECYWGFRFLEKQHANPDLFLTVRQQMDKLLREMDKTDPVQIHKELQSVERFILARSARMMEPAQYSANYGQRIEERRKSMISEFQKYQGDWKRSILALKRHGIELSVDYEISRINEFRDKYPDLNCLPTDAEYEQAYVYYKNAAQEKIRLASRILMDQFAVDAILRAAAFGNEKGLKKINSELQKSARLITAVNENRRKICNRGGDLSQLFDEEKKAGAAISALKRMAFDERDGQPAIRPGTGFFGSGSFGFNVEWQTLLNFNLQGGAIYLSNKEEFQPYDGFKRNWEVDIEPPDSKFIGHELRDGSWTYSHVSNVYQHNETGKTFKIDCWATTLTPGPLYETNASEISVFDSTDGAAVAPDQVAGVFDGKPMIFDAGNSIPFAQMSEGWLLFIWKNNQAPKLPILIYFENKPERLTWQKHKSVLGNSSGLGKFAVTLLYGAVPQKIDFYEKWNGKIPEHVLEQCRKMADCLAYFPYDLEEFYAKDSGRFKIWNRVTGNFNLDKNWERKANPYLPIPPLYALGMAGNADIKVDQSLSEPVFASRFGFFRTVSGKELSYSIPAPDMLNRIVLKPSGEEEYIKRYNSRLKESDFIWFFRDMYTWLPAYMEGACLMDRASKDYTDTARRYHGEIENLAIGQRYCMKIDTIADYIVEPFTGRGSVVCGWRGHNQGGDEIRGDMTAFNTWYLSCNLASASLFDRWFLVERNWDFLKDVYAALPFSYPWQVPGMNTLTSGLIIYGDMLGDGFRGSQAMYWLAKNMKDNDLATDSLYHGAKTTMSIACFVKPNIIEYNAHIKNLPDAQSPDAALNQLGVGQYGFKTAPWKKNGKSEANCTMQTLGVIAYDYPIYGIMVRFMPYDSMAWINKMMTDVPEWASFQYMTEGAKYYSNNCNYLYGMMCLKFLAVMSTDRKYVRDIYEKAFPFEFSPEKAPVPELQDKWNKNIYTEYLRYDARYRSIILPQIIAQNDPVWIGDFGKAKLVSGSYDREHRIAEINLNASEAGILIIVALAKPENITVNGKKLLLTPGYMGRDYEIPFEEGNSRVLVQIPEFKREQLGYPDLSESNPHRKLNLQKAPEARKFPRSSLLPEGDFHVGNCKPLDIAKFVNMPFNESAPGVKGDNVDVWKFPKGISTVRGVPFHFIDPDENFDRSCIFLKGQWKKEFPGEIKNIPVNCRAKRIFFLHGVCGGGENKGKVLTYRINFEDGQTKDVDVVIGLGIDQWKLHQWNPTANDLPQALAGNFYPPGRKNQFGHGLGGYVYVWENDVLGKGITNQAMEQRSRALVKSIDIISAESYTPVVLAITTEE